MYMYISQIDFFGFYVNIRGKLSICMYIYLLLGICMFDDYDYDDN